MKKNHIHIIISLIIFIPLVATAIILSPSEASAISATSPFGGKVKTWIPEDPKCADITTEIMAATAGTVIITIERLEVEGPNGGTFGILRVDGATLPLLTTIYDYNSYMIPGNWVIGSSFDLCNAGSKLLGDGLGKAVGKVCNLAGDGGGCPINNLVHKVGSSLIPTK